ncbi:MAG TPA: chitobiase/beta-hexosaminidase C-terminal domain-containing protein, partial [Candidatus Wallbacteria bacterium]|nr:chitobiase/beta-hexosaminidase C-terminal domain-containing protein [Candidatus Wallbacteria bacterium]
MRYTLDGSTPSATAGNIYSGPVTLSNTTTVKAVAVKSGYSDSPVATAVYTLPNKAAAPVISPGSATYTTAQTVTIVTSTVGATIKFTTDGSIPSETNGLVYTGAFTVSATATIKAVAIKTGIINSNIVSASFVINTEKAATPVFSPAGGTYSTAQSVNLTTSTNGAIIKYTTDGSTPSSSNGLTYSSAISVNATTTIKAVATKTNMADSEVATAAYTIQEAVSAPVFNPPAGTYDGTQSVSIISGTGGATIFYTLNGSEPTILSTQYNSAISITSNTTLKAIAVKSGMTASSVSTAAYTILQKAAAPSFDPVAGSYSGTQSVSITSLTANASIYYTLDNSTPTTSSTLYNNSPVSISSTGILKAIAVKSGMTNSDVSMAAYTISFPPVADPQFSVASGTYNQNQSVTLSCATEGASIYYTLDGATPTSASSLYTSAISIASTAIIKAIAIKAGMANSNINAASYVIDKQAPSFTIDYYSDSALTLSLGTNPRLSAGTYYLKITASKTLQSAPTISISAEGTANDNTNAATTAVSGNDYKYTRVIAYDALAIGAVIEDISISATDAAGNAASNISPTNEAAKAAYTDTVAPVATLTYSPSTAVKQGATLVINAVISESLMNTPSLKIAISDANTLAATDMTRTDATHYTYSHAVGAGNGNATAALSNAKDLAGNAITAAPVNPTFAVDNTAPTAPTAVTITPAGGTVKANTINLTNTNMTAQATITAAEATGGSAQLLIDNVVKAHDTTIAAGDTTVAFDLGKTSAAELQATIPVALNGKTVTVKLIDAAGNETTSAVANPTITVDYTAPTAPTSVTVTPAGGTVVANTLNSTNTNMTAAATITANQAVGGKAQLLIDGVVKAEDAAIAADETAVAFTLGQTTANGLQTAVPATLNGKTVTVKVIDAAGNETTSAVANPTITVDYTAPTGSLSYVPSASPAPGTSLSIIAAFSEPLADSPVIQIAISGQNTLSATNMSKTSTTSYAYIHTVANGSGAANVTFSTGTDAAGNPVTAAPTAGASFTVTNTVIPAGVYKKAAALANINDATISGNTLTIKTAGFDAVYDVTGNATVISIMGQLPAGNTFTIDSTGKVSAIDASLATGTPSIALTASQCAAGINVKGFSNAALTLTGSAASQAININITGGTVDVSNANLTGTLTMNTAAAATITSGAKSITVGATAAASAVAITGTAGGRVSVDAAASNVTINEIKVDPSGTATIAVTGANAISAAGGNINFVINATTDTAAKTFAFTGATAQTGTISAGASETTNGLTITAAAGTSDGAITITGGKVDVSGTNLTGSVTMDTNAIASIISGTKTVTIGPNAAASAVAITGTAGGSVSVDAAASNVTINEIKVDPSGTATIAVTGANAISAAGGNINFVINATTDTAAKTFAFTGATAQTGTISAGASETTNGLTITAAAGTSDGAITITGGKVDVSDTNLTGAISATTAASIITAGTKNVTASIANVEIISAGTVDAAGNALKISNANTVTLAAAGTVTKTGAGALTINLSNGNVGAINVTGSPAITINNTSTNTPRTVGDITLVTGTLTINAGSGTSDITVGQTLGVTNGAVTINGGAANVEIGNIATSGALTISAGSGTVKTGTYSGTPAITGGGTGLITLGIITGNVTVTGHATADLNIAAVTATSVNITTGAAAVTVGAITGNASVTDGASGSGAVNFGTISGTLGITSANQSPINVALGANAVSGITTIAGGTAPGNKVTLTGT